MKGKVKVFFIISCILNILLITITIKNYMKPDIYINPSDVRTITIVNVDKNIAKVIVEKDYIKEICSAFNHADVTLIKDYEDYNKRVRYGGSPYEFQFELKNFKRKILLYESGEYILQNGDIYETTNTEIEKFWDIVEPIKEWTPEHVG